MHTADWKKYFYVLLVTAAIFVTAFFVSDTLGNKKIEDIQTAQNRVSIDILSSETQFALLSESSCETVGDTSLSKDLDSLGTKLSYAETNLTNKEEVLWLKKNYSLLEIKDYVLMKKLAERCKVKPVYVLYFYSNKTGACPDCQKQGAVLTELRKKYPGLRVYSFDYDLDLAALKTLVSLYKVEPTFPALVIHKNVEYGWKSVENMETDMPELVTLTGTTTEATTTVEGKK
jgi:thiol-disulfide isomerase/thioredoxin